MPVASIKNHLQILHKIERSYRDKHLNLIKISFITLTAGVNLINLSTFLLDFLAKNKLEHISIASIASQAH